MDVVEWVSQFIADARVVDSAVKPLVVSSLSDKNCKHLPTVLHLMCTRANLFGDIGALLVPLASNPDREIRWRVAYLISRMRRKQRARGSAHTVANTQIRKPRIIKNSTAKTDGFGAWLIRRLIPRSPTKSFTLMPAGIRRETEAPTAPNGVIIVTLPLDALRASTVGP